MRVDTQKVEHREPGGGGGKEIRKKRKGEKI
jgi:hypothetical protein